jgi:hypothetical protein
METVHCRAGAVVSGVVGVSPAASSNGVPTLRPAVALLRALVAPVCSLHKQPDPGLGLDVLDLTHQLVAFAVALFDVGVVLVGLPVVSAGVPVTPTGFAIASRGFAFASTGVWVVLAASLAFLGSPVTSIGCTVTLVRGEAALLGRTSPLSGFGVPGQPRQLR